MDILSELMDAVIFLIKSRVELLTYKRNLNGRIAGIKDRLKDVSSAWEIAEAREGALT